MAKQSRHVESLAEIFRVLGDPTRLRIWLALQDKEECNVTELCRQLKAPQPTVSHHLGILRMHGLVTNRREGKEIHYSLNDLKKGTSTRMLSSLLNGKTAVRIGPLLLALADD